MNKNILYRIYSSLFIGICLIPAAFTPFVKNNESAEKRKLSEFPKIKTENNKINFEYFDEFESYFSEHFAFRQTLVTLDGYFKSKLLGTSSNDNVIVGKEGWLYYEETINDYLNINTLSNRGINNIKNNLEIINDYCTSNNVNFIFTVAPNKNSIYPEYMPSNYCPTNNEDNYQRLFEILDENFPYCDMKEVFLNTNSNIPLYHKEDTHWNNLGAYAVHARLMEMLNKEICPSGNWTIRNDRKSDLAEMIYPTSKGNDTQIYSDYNFQYQYLGRFTSFDDTSIRTSCEGKTGNLLMFRDSFGEAILPFIAECFGTAEFSRTVPYRLDSIDNGNIDSVILEIVERNIPDLQKYAPLMPAPAVNSLNIKNLTVCSDVTIKQEENGNYLHIFGELSNDFFTCDNTKIYVTANGITYRAFNAFEDKLLNREGELSDNGFSLYIPADSNITTDNITIISINDDGTAISSQ